MKLWESSIVLLNFLFLSTDTPTLKGGSCCLVDVEVVGCWFKLPKVSWPGAVDSSFTVASFDSAVAVTAEAERVAAVAAAVAVALTLSVSKWSCGGEAVVWGGDDDRTILLASTSLIFFHCRIGLDWIEFERVEEKTREWLNRLPLPWWRKKIELNLNPIYCFFTATSLFPFYFTPTFWLNSIGFFSPSSTHTLTFLSVFSPSPSLPVVALCLSTFMTRFSYEFQAIKLSIEIVWWWSISMILAKPKTAASLLYPPTFFVYLLFMFSRKKNASVSAQDIFARFF